MVFNFKTSKVTTHAVSDRMVITTAETLQITQKCNAKLSANMWSQVVMVFLVLSFSRLEALHSQLK